MKSKLRLLFVAVTLAAIALGLALPNIVSAARDRATGSQIASRGIESLSLMTSDAHGSALELLDFAMSMTKLFTGEELGIGVKESELEAMRLAALETINAFAEYGVDWIDAEQYSVHGEQYFLAINESDIQDMWCCTLISDNGDNIMTMILDDATKKMVSFNMFVADLNSSRIQTLVDALTEYYGFADGQRIEDDEICFTDTAGGSLTIAFSWTEDALYFNNSPYYNVTVGTPPPVVRVD